MEDVFPGLAARPEATRKTFSAPSDARLGARVDGPRTPCGTA